MLKKIIKRQGQQRDHVMADVSRTFDVNRRPNGNFLKINFKK